MKWLTNVFRGESNKIARELEQGHNGRVIVQGDPKATEVRSVDELKRQNMVGLYEQTSGQ